MSDEFTALLPVTLMNGTCVTSDTDKWPLMLPMSLISDCVICDTDDWLTDELILELDMTL